MTDKDQPTPGLLSAAQHAELTDWLKQKWGEKKPCPMCSLGPWVVLREVLAIPVHTKGIVVGGAMMPVVPIVCHSCGFAVFLAPGVAGIQPTAMSPTASTGLEAKSG